MIATLGSLEALSLGGIRMINDKTYDIVVLKLYFVISMVLMLAVSQVEVPWSAGASDGSGDQVVSCERSVAPRSSPSPRLPQRILLPPLARSSVLLLIAKLIHVFSVTISCCVQVEGAEGPSEAQDSARSRHQARHAIHSNQISQRSIDRSHKKFR